MRTTSRIAALMLTALAVGACSGDSDPMPPDPVPECRAVVVLAVSAAPTPVFSWTPICRHFSLVVEETASGDTAWAIVSDTNGNTIAPDVRYGETPLGAVATVPPRNLVSGTNYTVTVNRLFSGEEIINGFAEFEP